MSEAEINAALGLTYEYGDRAPLVPASYYPARLHVVSTGTSEPKVKYVDGEEIEGGNFPFIEISADIDDGPFKGFNVTRKSYITPGASGKGMGRWLGACHAITGQYPPTGAVCQKFGIVLPNPAQVRPIGKEAAEHAYKNAMLAALAEGFFAMDAATRLAFIATLVGVVSWDGKRAIVKIGLETQYSLKGSDVRYNEGEWAKLTPQQQGDELAAGYRAFSNNNFDGFLPLGDAKKGLSWVVASEFPRQLEAKAAMETQAAGVTGS